MKFLLSSFLLLGIYNVVLTAPQVNGVGDIIGDLIAEIIKGLIQKISDNITDPINVDEFNFNLTWGDLASGHFEVSDLSETGLKGFEISSLSVSLAPPSINVVLDVPSINIDTNYDADIVLGSLIPIYGNGLANINFKNLRVNFTSGFDFNLVNSSLKLKNVTVLVSSGDATFDLHGILNNEAFSVIVSQILDDTVSTFINTHSELISNIVSPILEYIVNSILSGSTTSQVYNSMVEGFSQEDFKNFMMLFTTDFKNHPKFDELS